MGKPNHSAQPMPDERFRLSCWPYCGSGKGAETCASCSALAGDLPAQGWVWWARLLRAHGAVETMRRGSRQRVRYAQLA
jgi:hypothetical protein